METTHYFQRINIVDFCKLWFIYNFQFTKQKKKKNYKKCLNWIWFLTDLSHRQKPSSLMVGTVCCGFIWKKNDGSIYSFLVKHWISYHINASPCCRYQLSKLIFWIIHHKRKWNVTIGANKKHFTFNIHIC